MHIFNYSFLDNGLLPADFVNVTSSISSLKALAIARKSENIKIFTELESIARIQSIKSSNAIEGIVTTDERIKAIVNESTAPLNHNEAEIAGYRDALNIIHTGYKEISFSEKSILSLHKTLMNVANYDYGGMYKAEDNVILEIDSNGNRNVRFRPTPAAETKFAMEQLELAYMEASANTNINQLLLIPCVILDFLCIHPFKDGNGRMSRLLSLLLLYKNDFDVGKFISFEEQINKSKDSYYSSLKASSENWENNTNNYFPFMRDFLLTLYKCYKELDKRFAFSNIKRLSKKERIAATVLESLLPISKAEICTLLPDVSPTTIEAVLAQMKKDSLITTIGSGRSTKYIKK